MDVVVLGGPVRFYGICGKILWESVKISGRSGVILLRYSKVGLAMLLDDLTLEECFSSVLLVIGVV